MDIIKWTIWLLSIISVILCFDIFDYIIMLPLPSIIVIILYYLIYSIVYDKIIFFFGGARG